VSLRYTRRGLLLAGGLGLGVGLMLGAAVLAAAPRPGLTDAAVVARARVLGMINPTELPPVQPIAKEAPAPAKVAVVLVGPGMDFGTVAEMLTGAGVISDPAAFLARVKERELTGRMQTGAHELPASGATVDQVIDKLTSAP
jgi:cell division protein YceG involved in septum cleavage